MKPFKTLSHLLATAIVLLAATTAHTAGKNDSAVNEALQRDLATCQKAADADARHDCRREAYAVRDEARRGTLAEGADFDRNRFARCEVHKDPTERSYCERRMRGEGTVSGSVEGGGLLRELKVTIPAE